MMFQSPTPRPRNASPSQRRRQVGCATRGAAVWQLRCAMWILVGLIIGATARAQERPIHYFHSADLPPGTVGQAQLLRGGPLPGYFQPVEILAPPGARISMVVGGQFGDPLESPALVGLLIGQVYRLKVTGIPGQEGFEVFPTIELINRLYPPPGLERHFPVPIHLTQQELEMALTGRFVTRVVYLEDPQQALPVQDDPAEQRHFEVRFDEDPLRVADRLGRPMAILRMGSRTPDEAMLPPRFAYWSPPLQLLPRPLPLPDRREGLEDPGDEAAGDIPRVPLGRAFFEGGSAGIRPY